MIIIFEGLDNDFEMCKMVGVLVVMDMVKIFSCEGVKDFYFYILNCVELSYVICYILGVRL